MSTGGRAFVVAVLAVEEDVEVGVPPAQPATAMGSRHMMDG
jgi:hypothetical protein